MVPTPHVTVSNRIRMLKGCLRPQSPHHRLISSSQPCVNCNRIVTPLIHGPSPISIAYNSPSRCRDCPLSAGTTCKRTRLTWVQARSNRLARSSQQSHLHSLPTQRAMAPTQFKPFAIFQKSCQRANLARKHWYWTLMILWCALLSSQ